MMGSSVLSPGLETPYHSPTVCLAGPIFRGGGGNVGAPSVSTVVIVVGWGGAGYLFRTTPPTTTSVSSWPAAGRWRRTCPGCSPTPSPSPSVPSATTPLSGRGGGPRLGWEGVQTGGSGGQQHPPSHLHPQSLSFPYKLGGHRDRLGRCPDSTGGWGGVCFPPTLLLLIHGATATERTPT